MRKYTRKIHIQRLRQMLGRDKPCKHCPPSQNFKANALACDLWCSSMIDCCTICREFVGLAALCKWREVANRCPCHVLGNDEAIKKTVEALRGVKSIHV